MLKKIGINYITKRASSSSTTNDIFSKSFLCSYGNRKRCIEAFRKNLDVRLSKEVGQRRAAVLIPLCVESDGTISLLYTLRASTLSKHIREVSFPGGMKDSNDQTYENCALRETSEEIGIPTDKIEIWGCGREVSLRHWPSVIPVVGMINNYSPDMLKINKSEVEKVFTAPLRDLCAADRKHTQYRGMYSGPVYLGFEQRIWGFTAFLTHAFLSALLPMESYNRKLKYVTNYKL